MDSTTALHSCSLDCIDYIPTESGKHMYRMCSSMRIPILVRATAAQSTAKRSTRIQCTLSCMVALLAELWSHVCVCVCVCDRRSCRAARRAALTAYLDTEAS